jgi:hypothetical protein
MNKVLRVASVFITLSFCLFVACDKGDDPVPEAACFMTSSEDSFGKWTYNYDSKIHNSFVYKSPNGVETLNTCEYDGEGNLTAFVWHNSRIAFTYAHGQIVKREQFTGTVRESRVEYEYLNERLVKIQEYTGTELNQKGTYWTLEYNDDSYNISHLTSFVPINNTTFSTTYNYTYGDKMAPSSAYPRAVLKYTRLVSTATENNLLKVVASNGEEVNYSYEFNDKGFPTKVTTTSKLGATRVQTFTYNCN